MLNMEQRFYLEKDDKGEMEKYLNCCLCLSKFNNYN